MNLGIELSTLLDKDYKFYYDLSEVGLSIDERIACYKILVESEIECSLLAGRIYFKNEADLNVLKMVM